MTLFNNNTDHEIQHEENKLRESDEDLQNEAATAKVGRCPFSGGGSMPSSAAGSHTQEPLPYQYIPLRMGGNGGTFKSSVGSKALIEHEVSLNDLKRMTHTFYDKAFQDYTLDKFIRSHEDPHGDRFAKWIHQKLSDSTVWDRDRRQRDLTPVTVAGRRQVVVHDRSSAHAAAWYSPKRPSNEVGRHFNLEECRVWMRLHFWAMRDSGIVEQSPSFADFYVRFIGHFVSVYERSATQFARESFRWSSNPKNIAKYIKNGRKMTDVLGVRYNEAINSLPPSESEDDYWPYEVNRQ